jgi:cell division protein FtsQ
MSRKKTVRSAGAPVRHRVLWIGGALLVVILMGCGTFYVSTMTVRRVEIEGALHASVQKVNELSGVAVGDTLYRLDPGLIESRIARHPWVESSEVTRWPTGLLSIKVSERTPVALSIAGSGRPAFYLDRTGHALPIDSLSRYDVPLIHGVADGMRLVSVRDTTSLQLLEVLGSVPAAVDGLLSDLVLQSNGEVEAITVPVHDGHCIRVRLGRGGFARKIETLRAFWTQAVAGFPNKRIDWIDLRYRGQVVTREESVVS